MWIRTTASTLTESWKRSCERLASAVVEAVLQDIEKDYGRYVAPEDEKRARRRAQHIRRKAVKYRILRG